MRRENERVTQTQGAARVSEREAEVLAALGERLSNAQIASRLHVSVRTVETHVSSLLRKFVVSLPNDAGLVTGQALHLARKRYDGVFPVPLSAVQPITDVEAKVWVAAPDGKAEQRSVTVAESRDEVLVSAGINVGDEVIVEPPRDLAPGTLVEPIR